MRISSRALLVAVLLAVSLATTVSPSTAASPGSDFPLASGHFYTQTGDGSLAEHGFRITDENGIPFWTEYQRLGGPDALGYPISQRFVWDGFVVQATQRAVLQWQPGNGRVVVLNLLDKMHDLGLDDWLAQNYSTPRPVDGATFDAGKSWPEIVKARLGLLDTDPAIKARYLSAAPGVDPLDIYGLPASPVEDAGNHYVVRFQRAVMQRWKVNVPWARAGEVTVANVGDVASAAGLFPPLAVEPLDARDSTLPDLIAPSPQADGVADAARPSVVRVVVPDQGFGTGFVITTEGHILTSNHVVAHNSNVVVEMSDGRRIPGTVVGADTWTDVAVIKVADAGLAPLALGSSDGLTLGEPLAALGYSPLFSDAPEPRYGQVLDFGRTSLRGVRHGLVLSDVYLQPGDSGGPLLNMRGEVVGIDAAIRVLGGQNGRLITTSVAIDRVKPVISDILASGRASRPWLGLNVGSLVIGEVRVGSGVLILDVVADSPAAQAGLKPTEVVVAADGQRVTQSTDLQLALAGHVVGDDVELTVLGEDGAQRSVTVRLAAAP